MKNHKTIIHLLFFTLILFVPFSCTEELEVSNQEGFLINPATKQAKNFYEEWAFSSAIDIEKFDSENLFRLEDLVREYVIYSVHARNNPNETLNFGMLKDGTIINSFVSVVTQIDGKFQSEISSLNNTLIFKILDHKDGIGEIEYTSNNSRIEGWGSDFEDCVDDMANPTSSPTGNLVFGVIASAATVGMWPAAILVVCAGVASGKALKEIEE